MAGDWRRKLTERFLLRSINVEIRVSLLLSRIYAMNLAPAHRQERRQVIGVGACLQAISTLESRAPSTGSGP
jgi:hypothetical protein